MVNEKAAVGVFGGPERVIPTNLTMHKCLHRLHGDNAPPLGWFGWKPFKYAPTIHPKLRGDTLRSINSTGSRQNAWMFYADVVDNKGVAAIKGRY